MTINTSSSGVLFTSREVLPAGAEVELHLMLEPTAHVARPAEIVCSTQVVRVCCSEDPDALPEVAVRILQYHFSPRADESCSAIGTICSAPKKRDFQ